MEVREEGRPVRAKYCDKCDSLFYFSHKDLAVTESIAVVRAVGA